jgi:hypothetical protein
MLELGETEIEELEDSEVLGEREVVVLAERDVLEVGVG